MKLITGVFVIFILVAFACKEDENSVSGRGTIIYFSFEGGFYGIITEKGDHFLPENLSSNFQEDSIRVYFEGIITDHTTVQQWGKTITLTHIQRIQ